jgi:hypothetical protein
MSTDLISYTVEAYNTAKYGVQTRRPGLSVVFENRVHDDDVAQLFGFAAGLVPGVDIYAYMTQAPVRRWGRAFLERGTITCRFLKPIYDREVVRVTAEETADGLDLKLETRGELCATGRASLPVACAPLPAWDSFAALDPRPYKLPADESSLGVGDWLGSYAFQTPAEWAVGFLEDMREREALYANEWLIHPGQLLRMMNWAVIDNVLLVPWLFLGSTVHHLNVAPVGEPLGVRALITGNYERKGHRFVDLEGVVLSAGRPVAHVLHTVIYQPRQAATAYKRKPAPTASVHGAVAEDPHHAWRSTDADA